MPPAPDAARSRGSWHRHVTHAAIDHPIPGQVLPRLTGRLSLFVLAGARSPTGDGDGGWGVVVGVVAVHEVAGGVHALVQDAVGVVDPQAVVGAVGGVDEGEHVHGGAMPGGRAKITVTAKRQRRNRPRGRQRRLASARATTRRSPPARAMDTPTHARRSR
jgi:hypothetical protein